MARRQKKQPVEQESRPDNRIQREIWSILYTALGILVFISLVSSFFMSPDNLLGPFGRRCAEGLKVIFGPVPAFSVPLAALAVGYLRIKQSEIPLRAAAFWVLFTLELCLLLAIHDIPITEFRQNWLGHRGVKLLEPIFGPYRFGPYFLVCTGIIVTSIACFRLEVKTALDLFVGWCRRIAEALRRMPAERKEAREKKKQMNETLLYEQEKEKPDSPTTGTTQAHGYVPETNDEAEESGEHDTPDATKAVSITITPPVDRECEAEEPIPHDTVEEAVTEILDGTGDDDAGQEADKDNGNESDDPLHDSGDVPDDYYRIPGALNAKKKKRKTPYRIPSPDVINEPPAISTMIDRQSIEHNSYVLEKTLLNFGLEGKVVNVSPGPVITRYEIELAPGIKVSRVVNLQDDISMAVGGQKIRIQAPIPGKAAIGIELPNKDRQIVYFKHILQSDAFRNSRAKLPVIIGRTTNGQAFVADIAKMPHMLIAGQTGSGKSVCINSLICSLLMTKKPEELRLILVDPKKVEMSYYEGIPHLMSPVVTESKEAVKALQWGEIEMERRYRLMAKVNARNIGSFNGKIASGSIREGILSENENKPLPFIVIIVDELADLMMTASKDVEGRIQRIAQLARAVGLHLVVATQRPSVDIITGPIKANLTSRIAFRTIQSTDSRTILGHVGSEKLLGMGDMLFLRSGAPDIERYHGAFISEEDVEKITDSIRSQFYEIEKIERFGQEHETETADDDDTTETDEAGEHDELFREAASIIVGVGQGSTSFLQRRLKIGYARAGRLMDELEAAGIVGPQEGSKVRDVLVKPQELESMLEVSS